MYCQKCGKEVNGNFCTNCGNKVDIPSQQATFNAGNSKNNLKKPIYKKWWFWTIIVLVIFMIGSNGSNKTSNNLGPENGTIIEAIEKPEEAEEFDYTVLFGVAEENKDKWVTISGKIDSKSSEYLKTKYIDFTSGFDTSGCKIRMNINPNLDTEFANFNKNDYVTITGQVGEKDNSTLNINNAYIEFGGENSKTINDMYFSARYNEKKQEFIKSCETYAYKDIARNPDNYKGKKIKFTGKVVQVQEDTFGNGITLRINVTKGNYGIYSDTVYCRYTYYDGESKILDDDIVTFYGICSGDTSYTTVLGSKVTIPSMDIKYITVKK